MILVSAVLLLRTDRQTESHTEADDRYTHVTTVGVSNKYATMYDYHKENDYRSTEMLWQWLILKALISNLEVKALFNCHPHVSLVVGYVNNRVRGQKRRQSQVVNVPAVCCCSCCWLELGIWWIRSERVDDVDETVELSVRLVVVAGLLLNGEANLSSTTVANEISRRRSHDYIICFGNGNFCTQFAIKDYIQTMKTSVMNT